MWVEEQASKQSKDKHKGHEGKSSFRNLRKPVLTDWRE